LLQGRGVTLLAHTSDHYLRFYQQAIPCKLREATFNLDGLIEHDTELDPKTCFTNTHGYTEVVMATAAMLGFELAPRIRDIKDQTLYKPAPSRNTAIGAPVSSFRASRYLFVTVTCPFSPIWVVVTNSTGIIASTDIGRASTGKIKIGSFPINFGLT